MPTIHNIPDELITEAFWYLGFGELLVAARVSHWWRDLGIDHPLFWKKIKLTGATRGAIACTRARLGQSRGRPYELAIDIRGLNPLIPTVLLRLVNSMLDTAYLFDIRIDSWYLTELWRVMNRSAPMLQIFRVELYCPDRILARIPLNPWIFDNVAAQLHNVFITDVLLPSDAPMPAFSTAKVLTFIQPRDSSQPFPTYVFEKFPSLRGLWLEGGWMRFKSHLDPVDTEGLSRLTVLDINYHPDCEAEFIRLSPVRDIPSVLVGAFQGFDFDATYDLLEPLRSPFNLSMLAVDANEFHIVVTECSSGYRRAFSDVMRNYPSSKADSNPDLLNVLFDNEDFATQLHEMCISTAIWNNLVSYIGCFSGITALVVEYEQGRRPDIESLCSLRPFAFPHLRRLVLETRYYILWLDADDVVRFADALAGPQCTELELRRVMIAGRDRVRQRFETITWTSTSRTWSSRADLMRLKRKI